jgi:hypothetical protein
MGDDDFQEGGAVMECLSADFIEPLGEGEVFQAGTAVKGLRPYRVNIGWYEEVIQFLAIVKRLRLYELNAAAYCYAGEILALGKGAGADDLDAVTDFYALKRFAVIECVRLDVLQPIAYFDMFEVVTGLKGPLAQVLGFAGDVHVFQSVAVFKGVWSD